MDAWQRLRPVTFGPINDFNRLYRIQFWPDKRGSISTHLDKVLREQPEDILKPVASCSHPSPFRGCR